MHSTTFKAARAGLDWTQKDFADAAGMYAKSVAWRERRTGNLAKSRNGAIRGIKEALAQGAVSIEGKAVRHHLVANHLLRTAPQPSR